MCIYIEREIHMYMDICIGEDICMYVGEVYVYMYIYIYRERERGGHFPSPRRSYGQFL